MDGLIARALRGYPTAEEIKLILALNHTWKRKPKRTKEIITTLLPRSILLNCENVRRVMCLDEDPDPRLQQLKTNHTKAAFIFHLELVNGLIIILNFHTNTVLKAVERLITNPTSQITPKRALISRMFTVTSFKRILLACARADPSPEHLVVTHHLLQFKRGTVAGRGSTPSPRRRSASPSPTGRSHRKRALLPPLDEDGWSLFSFTFGEEPIEKFKLDKEKMHLVPESTITMFDEDSINSIDIAYQREFYDMIKQFDEAGPDETDMSGFGTPGDQKPFYFDYSTPIRSRRALFEEQLKDLPTDEELMQLSALELRKDAQKRMPRPVEIKEISPSQAQKRRIIKRGYQVPESGFSRVPQSTPRVLQLEVPPVPWTLRTSYESEESYRVLSPVLHPESLVRPPHIIDSRPLESTGPATQQLEIATVSADQQERIPFQVYHDSEDKGVSSPPQGIPRPMEVYQDLDQVVPPVAQAPEDANAPPADAMVIEDFAVRLRDHIAESSRATVVTAETRQELTQERTGLQLDLFHARSENWFRMTTQQWSRKILENWKTKRPDDAPTRPTETAEEQFRQVSEWASRDLPVPTLQDRRWMTDNKWNLDIREEVMTDILGGRMDAPRGEEEARLSMEEEQARQVAGDCAVVPLWDDDAALTAEEADELLYRAYHQRDASLPLPFDPSPRLRELLTQSGLVAVRDDSVEVMDEPFIRLCLRALDWDQERNNWFLNNSYFDPNVEEDRLFVGTTLTGSDILPRSDGEELTRMFATQRPPLVSVSANFRWPDWQTRLHSSEAPEMQSQAPPHPQLFPEADTIPPHTIEVQHELSRVQDDAMTALTAAATVPSTSSALDSATTGTAQLAMARSVSSVGGISLQAIASLGSDPRAIDSFLKSFRIIAEDGQELELYRTGEFMGLQTSYSTRPVSSVSRPSSSDIETATRLAEVQEPPLPLELSVSDTTVVQARVSSAQQDQVAVDLEALPQLDLTVGPQQPDTAGHPTALQAPEPIPFLRPRDPIELRPREAHPPLVDDVPTPRRRRRRVPGGRRRRVPGRRRTPSPPPVPPPVMDPEPGHLDLPEPMDLPVAVADLAAGPGEPMDITDAVAQPVIEHEGELMELTATVMPVEQEDINYWSETAVLGLLSDQQVLCFSDLCIPGECSRREAASLFKCLLNLNAQKRVKLWQDEPTGDPDKLFIQGVHSTVEQALE